MFWASLIRKKQCSRYQAWIFWSSCPWINALYRRKYIFQLYLSEFFHAFTELGGRSSFWGNNGDGFFSECTSLNSIFSLQCFSLPGTFGCTKSERIYNLLLLEEVAGRQMTTVPLIEYYYKRSVNYLLASHAVEKLIWMTFSRCCFEDIQ